MRMGGLLEQQRSTELKKVELASSSEPTQKAIILKSYTIWNDKHFFLFIYFDSLAKHHEKITNNRFLRSNGYGKYISRYAHIFILSYSRLICSDNLAWLKSGNHA